MLAGIFQPVLLLKQHIRKEVIKWELRNNEGRSQILTSDRLHMARAEEIYSLEIEILAQTLRAVLIEVNEEKHWIPRSQLFDDDDLPEKGKCFIKMSAWIAKEKGLI